MATDEQLDREDVIRELRRVAKGLDRPVTRLDLEGPMSWAVLRWFGSISDAREAAGLPQPDRNVKWNRDRVIDEIRRLSRRGVVITRSHLRAADRYDLIGAISDHVGSIVRARRLAGVPEPAYQPRERQRWDEERVLDEIASLDGAGESLAPSKAPSALVKAAIYYFKSWRNAIEAAGLDYDKVRLVREAFTDDELLDRLRALAGKKPAFTAGELSHIPWREALVKHFGTLENAVRRAGIEGWPVRIRQRALSERGVIKALRSRRRAGKSTYMDAVRADDHRLFHSVFVHYASWKQALAAARLRSDSPQQNSWTRESLIAAIVARHERGGSLRRPDVLREDSPLVHSASVRLGSWHRALRAAGIEVDWAPTRWTKQRVVAELRRVAAGRSELSWDQAGNKLATAAQRHFGSYRAACKAAGLSTARGSKIAARFRGSRLRK